MGLFKILVKFVCVLLKNTEYAKTLHNLSNLRLFLTFWALWVILGWFMSTWFIQHKRPFLPQGVHSWAQADRFALALNFTENGLHFTESRTLYQGSKDARVGVEFPLNSWLSAAILKISGSTNGSLPKIFRWVNWVLSGMGFYLLFLLLSAPLKQALGSFMLITLAGVSPVLMFYGFGFAPDAVALSFSLLAFGFFLLYTEQTQSRWLLFSLFSAILAALVKISSGIFLIGIMAGILHTLYIQKTERRWIHGALAIVMGFGGIGLVAWYVWNHVYQVNINFYSPVFMSKANPVESLTEWRRIFKGMAKWESGYFTTPQYVFLAWMILQSGVKKLPVVNPLKMSTRSFFLTITFIGLLFYTVAFGKQLPDHDYYFVSSFLAWSVMASTVFLLRHPYVLSSCLTALVLPLLSVSNLVYGYEQFQARQYDVYYSGKQEIRNHAEWLMQFRKDGTDQLIPVNSKVFVVYEYEPNLSLVYLNRKGMVFNHEEMGRPGGHFQYWLNQVQPRYLLIRNEWNEQLIKDQESLYQTLQEIKKTDQYTLFRIP